jgi:membrane dipeptidase
VWDSRAPMRHFLGLALLFVACARGGEGSDRAAGASATASAPASAVPPANETPDQRASRIHAAAIIVDGHNDIPSKMFAKDFDLASPPMKTHTDLARLKSGGITAEWFSIFVDRSLYEHPTALGGGPARRALDLIDVTYRAVERHPELTLALTPADIRLAKRDGKIAVLMGIEGGHAIENSLFALRDFYRLGVRYMTLTHTNTNDWADSAGFDGPAPVVHHGLSPFGEEVVREMQRIGMLVDVSHVSDETFDAVMRVAKAPVIASHSSARAVADHRRNLSDDMLRAMAKNGGVVMVNFYDGFIDPAYIAADRAFMEKNKAQVDAIRAAHPGDPLAMGAEIGALKGSAFPTTPLSVLVDHIAHIAEVAGIDHVGLGSDFDGVGALPDGITGVESLPKITRALVDRGFSDMDIWKILGENFLRVFADATAYAKSTGTSISGDGSTRKIQ